MNHFETFGLSPQPWLDVELLKREFLRMSAEVHPDKVTETVAKREAEARFTQLNQAYETLRNTRTRLLHYLELMGFANSAHVQAVPPAALEFFEAVAEQTRKADELLKQKNAATSPMLKVQFFEKSLGATAGIQEVQGRIAGKIREIESRLQVTGEKVDELQAAAAALGFLERWSAQLQQRLAALAF